MARWDIDPNGVKGVLTKVGTHAEDLSTAANSVSTDVMNCGSAIGASIVTQALSDFATARSKELQDAGTRVSAAVTGTVNAVTAYEKGNLEMAKNAQAAATRTS